MAPTDRPAFIGKYELLDYLGGGMSQVFRARDTLIDRIVVVKILTDTASNDPEAKARFLQEAKLAGGFQHENIVAVYDYGEHLGRPFMVMEYLRGEDLRSAIRNQRTGPLMNQLRIARDVASALDFVHSKGITHRDIKPENVHIDANGKVKLMDFGIAKTRDMSLTRTGMAMGTPYYMSPEQVRGQPVTILVDIYAWGLLLFELLTGTRSVGGETMEAVFYQILNVPVDTSAMAQAGVPPPVIDLVARCAAKETTVRPQSFSAVVAELNALMGGDAGAGTQAGLSYSAGPSPMPTAAFGGAGVTSYGQAATEAETPAPAPPSRKGLIFGIAGAAAAAIVAVVVFLILNSSPKPPPAPPAVAGMVYIPAGTFLAGEDKHPVPLGAFYIDETEVTNAQFAEFCNATGCNPPSEAANLPVVNVTIKDARAFAKWKGKRLPTALEWERAARGDKGAAFPWGDEADPSRANVANNSQLGATPHLTPVKTLPPALGLWDMVGNAWEMVDGPVQPSAAAVAAWASRMKPPPTAQEPWIAARGGAYNTPLSPGLTWDQLSIPERFTGPDIGFRCAKDAPAK